MAVLPPTPESEEAKKLVLTESKCVAFLGAGISIPPGGSWKKLVSDIATQCSIPFDDNVPITEYPSIIDRCITQSEDGCNRALQTSLPEHVPVSRTAVDYIHRLQLKAILTTNFDPWIHQHSRQARYERGVHIYPDIPLNLGTKGHIYYLHGYFASDSPDASIRKLILGKQSFQDAYVKSSFLPGFLLNIFVYENILFIGFNPTEHHVSALLKESMVIRRQIPVGPAPKRFILMPAPSGSTPEERAKESAFISDVQFLDIMPVYYDNSAGDHVGIEELLSSWISESDLKDRPAPFKTGFET